MSRKEFSSLLQLYLEGKCSDEEKELVEFWFGVLQNEQKENVNLTDIDSLEPLLWKRIQTRTGIQSPEPSARQRFPYWKLAAFAAASVLLIFSLIWFNTEMKTDPVAGTTEIGQKDQSWVTEKNDSKENRTIILADGSKVMLHPGSSIRFPENFLGDERQIVLTGQAFFNVSHQPERPFLVFAGNLITRVLGTSFYIKTQPQKSVSVEVVTGRVVVSERVSTRDKTYTTGTEVILSSNQKAVYSEEAQQLVTGLVDEPVILAVPEEEVEIPSFLFEDIPLHNVLQELERSYGISIILENSLQKSCPLTADLTGLKLFEQLEMICAATKSKYSILGTTILISGQGCSNLE